MSIPAHRPRIALVVHDFDAGFGQGRYCVELVRRLSGDFTFTVFCNTYRSAEAARAAGATGLRVVPVPALRTKALTTIFSFVAAAEARLLLAPCDLIHAQGLSSWRADVVTAHMCNAAKLAASAAAGAEHGSAQRSMRLVVPLERAFFRRNGRGTLLSISRSVEQEVVAAYGWPGERRVIYHGTDAERFAPAPDAARKAELQARYGLSPRHWNWLFMGEAVKGLAETIAALARFPEARLLVVSRSDARQWQALAAARGVAAQLVWHGFDAAPEDAFRAADLFCYPSFYDPFGMVAAEAMASGLPVVLGRRTGVAELVDDGVEGLLCDTFDEAGLVRVLGSLRAAPERARAMGQAARARIEQHGWDACAAATGAAYEAVLRRKTARAGR